MKKITHNKLFSIVKLSFITFICIVLATLTACSEETLSETSVTSESIIFEASVSGQDDIVTRLSTYNISSEYYQCDFHLYTEQMAEITEEYPDFSSERKGKKGLYVIPSGYSGTLMPKEEYENGILQNNSINWFGRKTKHNFWGWTLPSGTFSQTTDEGDYDFEDYVKDGIKVYFKDTSMSDLNSDSKSFKAGSYENGAVFEQLLGAAAGPYIYETQGMYVPLQFRHMVSKIILTNFNLINNVSGASNTTLKGLITIYGLPQFGTFYPCPIKENGESRYPYVAMPDDWNYDQSTGQTFVISNYSKNLKWEGQTSWSSSNQPVDCWYICPEVDLSKLSFKIQIYEYKTFEEETDDGIVTKGDWVINEKYGDNGAYYGNFLNIKFTRNKTNYDDPNGGDETILHAGEYLSLKINIQQKGNPTVQGNITAWASPSYKTGNSHVHQGLYNVSDVRNFNDVMSRGDEEEMDDLYNMFGGNRNTSEDDPTLYPDYEELYGHELNIFDLFQDAGSSSAHSSSSASGVDKINGLVTGDDYILDGNGHTVESYSTTINVGHVRNIYISQYYYNAYSTPRVYYHYIIYIDNMGNVWKVDPDTYEHTLTNYNINNPDKNPVSLNLSSGEVG